MKRGATALLPVTKETGGSESYPELPDCFSQPKDTRIRPGDLIVSPLQNLGRLFDGGPSSERPDAGRGLPRGMEREASHPAYSFCGEKRPHFIVLIRVIFSL